ncbi:hypothetical protein [Desulfobacula sp.]|uniref:hypothetical protein n=1 Tax=Desulfobacula sp. TaxID=2593537 RepID=UPI002714633C|nr:hypothetical protein [Desulfobacula sp.]
MIEIVPHSDSFRGSYNVSLAVDSMAYLYIYNDVFVEEWNQYVKKIEAGSDFIKSKWFMEESEPANDVSFETLSHEEKIGRAANVGKFFEDRRGKKGRYFEKLVDDFDRDRNLIACYNTKFYTYVIETKFADHISVYLIEEHEVTDMISCLYMKIKKRDRCMTRKQLIGNFEINGDD